MNIKAYIPAVKYAMNHPGVKTTGLVMLACIVLLIIALIIWVPFYIKHLNLSSTIEGYRNSIYASQNEKRIAKIYSRSNKTVNKIYKKLGSKKGQAEHVKLLDKILQKRRLTVVNETFETEEREDGYFVLTQELAIHGDYLSLRKFILELDRLPTWTVVQALKIEKLHSYGSKVKAVLKMSTYRIEPGKNNEAG